MHALPFALALVAAALLAPIIARGLVQAGATRPNFRGRALPFPFGVLVVSAALIALIPLVLLSELGGVAVFETGLGPVAVYVLGVALLGLIDDSLPAAQRGWRGHAGEALAGRFSTGALKAAGSLGLALLVMSGQRLAAGRYLLAVAVLVLATNLFNLLDLRPGRAAKAFVIVGATLTLATMNLRPLWSLGLFAGPVLVAGAYDLRERAMLGDLGANLIGALAGLWLVLSLTGTGLAVAAPILLVITIYGEFRSINSLIERIRPLRALDSWGRP